MKYNNTILIGNSRFIMHIILCSDMPCEVGAAALYQFFVKDSAVIQMKVDEARSFEITSAKILTTLANRDLSELIFLGTYWNDCFIQLCSRFKDNVNFTLYCFGKVPSFITLKDKMDITTGCQWVKLPCVGEFLAYEGERGAGPAGFLFNLAEETIDNPMLVKFYKNSFSRVINLIDDRVYNRNITESQPFYTGLFNSDPIEVPLFEKFLKLFQGDYTVDEVIKSGRSIVAAQINMARERVVRNSKQVSLSDGTSAVVAEANDLVNLTHDALHNHYPEAKVTLIMNMRFGREHDELAYSLRSFDTNIDVSDLAKKVKGDGNRSAAGGRVQFDFPIPF